MYTELIFFSKYEIAFTLFIHLFIFYYHSSDTEMGHVFEILPRERQGPVYPTLSTPVIAAAEANTVECRYSAIQYNVVSYMILRRLEQNLIRTHKTHPIWKKIDPVITASWNLVAL